MRTNCLKALLLGAVTLFSVCAVVSCNSADIEDLQTRVAVLEGMVQELESDLQAAMVTGATILSASQDKDGVWTLNLSSGQTITITPSSGGGTAVSVEEKTDAFVITVNGTAYAIPKGSAISSLVFCPGSVDIPVIEETLDVFFLCTPALTADQLASATFDIADAREVTKAGANLFKVEAVALDGDLLKVTVKCLAAEAGKTYTVAVKAVFNGTAISSNYFFITVSSGHEFDPENLQTPKFKDGVQVTTLDGELTGYHRALIPESAKNFVQGFKLTDWFSELPAGATFQLAPFELQNGNVQNRYQCISNALSPDGTWELKERLGTDCWNSEGKNGIIIYTIVNDQIIHKIFWQIDNYIPGMGGAMEKWLGENFPSDAQHMEIGTEQSVNLKWIVPLGTTNIDIAKLLLQATFPEGELLPDPIYLRHGLANQTLHCIQDALVMDGDDILFGNDGSKFIFGEKLTCLNKFSRGMVWRTTQPSWVSSIRENWSDDQKALANGECNGEIIGGWDGGGDIPDLMGWYFNENGLNFTSKWEGWGFRTGLGAYYEYDLGEQTIGPWHWAYIFINRRVAPYEEGKGIDPNSR